MGSDIALGIDVGGTFTDVLALDREGEKLVSAFKVLSRPENLSEGAVLGIDKYRESGGDQAAGLLSWSHAASPLPP